jgi:hypothetical protein
MHATTPPPPSLNIRALTDDDLSSLLASRCAAQVGDIFDRCAVQTSEGNHFTASAAAEIADLVFDVAGPLMVEIVALGTGISSDEAKQLSAVDRLVATLQIVELTLANSTMEELGERVLLKLFTSAARRSAMASGNNVRH